MFSFTCLFLQLWFITLCFALFITICHHVVLIAKCLGSFSIFRPKYGYLVRLYCSIRTNRSIRFVRFQPKNSSCFRILTDIIFVLCTEYISQQTKEEQSVCKIVIPFVINKKLYEFRIYFNEYFIRTTVLTNEQSEQNGNNQGSKLFLTSVSH